MSRAYTIENCSRILFGLVNEQELWNRRVREKEKHNSEHSGSQSGKKRGDNQNKRDESSDEVKRKGEKEVTVKRLQEIFAAGEAGRQRRLATH